ncbi:MAG: hypothetical protein GXY87_06165, partial [Tissierellia bacterium]|nr:hypothetical protein [Tissierellia bacterium]
AIKLEVDESICLGKTSFIKFSIIDEFGVEVPTAQNEVVFDVEGAKILGVDNGNSPSHERYQIGHDGVWRRKAFSGSGLLIIKATDEIVTIKANSDGLVEADVRFEVEKTDKTNYEISQKIGLNAKIDHIEKFSENLIEDIDIYIQLGEEVNLPRKVKVLRDGRYHFEDVSWSQMI